MKLLPQVGARLWLWLGQSDLRLAAGPGTLQRIQRLPESIPRPERKMKPWRKTWAFRLSTASLFFWVANTPTTPMATGSGSSKFSWHGLRPFQLHAELWP